jgi:hypothetical protein
MAVMDRKHLECSGMDHKGLARKEPV